MKVVLIMLKDDQLRPFPLDRAQVRLGRRQDCHLRIATRDVSRQHCDVIQRGNQIFVKDLGSSNGTFVNGKRVAEAELKAGDKLRVGPVTFVVQVDGKPPVTGPQNGPAKAAVSDTAPTKGAAPEAKTFELDDDDFDLDEVIDTLDEWEDDDDKKKK